MKGGSRQGRPGLTREGNSGRRKAFVDQGGVGVEIANGDDNLAGSDSREQEPLDARRQQLDFAALPRHGDDFEPRSITCRGDFPRIREEIPGKKIDGWRQRRRALRPSDPGNQVVADVNPRRFDSRVITPPVFANRSDRAAGILPKSETRNRSAFCAKSSRILYWASVKSVKPSTTTSDRSAKRPQCPSASASRADQNRPSPS